MPNHPWKFCVDRINPQQHVLSPEGISVNTQLGTQLLANIFSSSHPPFLYKITSFQVNEILSEHRCGWCEDCWVTVYLGSHGFPLISPMAPVPFSLPDAVFLIPLIVECLNICALVLISSISTLALLEI